MNNSTTTTTNSRSDHHYVPRWMHEAIVNELKIYKVVGLVGPRQSGKSTLCRKICQQLNYHYVTLDDHHARTQAEQNPHDFLNSLGPRAIIDEIQRMPALILSIKSKVDQNPDPGQFIITGSVDLSLHSRMPDSLAGRLGYLQLYPFAQGEILGSRMCDLTTSIRELGYLNQEGSHAAVDDHDYSDICEPIYLGGYPEAYKADSDFMRKKWWSAYRDNLIRKDLSSVLRHPLDSKGGLDRLMRYIAYHGCAYYDPSTMGQTLKLKNKDIKTLLDALRDLYIIAELECWNPNDLHTMTKRVKYYFLDSGFKGFIQGKVRQDMIHLQKKPKEFGMSFECFVFTEIYKLAKSNQEIIDMYYFRENENTEVDFVLTWPGKILGIEVKSATDLGGISLAGMHRLKELAGSEQLMEGWFIYRGTQWMHIEDGIYGVPIKYLWDGTPNGDIF